MRICCVSEYLRSTGTDNGTPGRVLCLPGYCCFVLSRFLMWWWGTSSCSPDSSFNKQKSQRLGRKPFQQICIFQALLERIPRCFSCLPQAGCTGLYGHSSLAIATQVGPGSASAEVNPCPSPDQTAAAPGLMIKSRLCFKVKSSSTPSGQQLLRASCKMCTSKFR